MFLLVEYAVFPYYVLMAKIKITVWAFRCERCGHEWQPHDINIEPTVCPKCKNPYWNKPRKRPAKKAK